VMCPCPEDGQDRYTESVILVPVPEADCCCDATTINRHAAVRIETGGSR
jgi:hypothetical protein